MKTLLSDCSPNTIYDKALEYYFKDLAICEKVFGTEHPDTKLAREKIELVRSKLN